MELLLLLEEFRLMDVITKERPGTATSFDIRREAYVGFHRNMLSSNMQKSFLADAMMNQLFVSLHEGMFVDTSIDWGRRSIWTYPNRFTACVRCKEVRKTIRISQTGSLALLKDLSTKTSSINTTQWGIPLPKTIRYFIIMKGCRR